MRLTFKHIYITFLILFVSLSTSFLVGCTSGRLNTDTLEQRKAKALHAYDSGLAALMREPTLNPDVIWVLKQIEKIIPGEKLHDFIEKRTAMSTEKHPALCSIIPDAPRVELPEQLPSGFARYRECLLAPFGTPSGRAISFIEEFLLTNEKNYVLTHQFIVLVWAEQMDLPLPDHLVNRKQQLLKSILKEQRKDRLFSDLYAERAAMLLYYGNPKEKKADDWVNTILKAQLDDGRWKSDDPSLIDYDGQAAVLSLPSQHTTVLCLWALQAYLDNDFGFK